MKDTRDIVTRPWAVAFPIDQCHDEVYCQRLIESYWGAGYTVYFFRLETGEIWESYEHQKRFLFWTFREFRLRLIQ